MRDKNNRAAFLVELINNVHQEAAVNWVETFGWFVENQQFWLVHDSNAELDFLLLPLRKLVDTGFGKFVKADAFEVAKAPAFGAFHAA